MRYSIFALFLSLNVFTFSIAFSSDSLPTETVKSAYGLRRKAETKVSVLSSDQALELFRNFQNQKQIPFNYRIDGCYARATEMAKIAESLGIELGKVFAEGNLRAKTLPPEKVSTVEWGWHVAPIASVETNGKRELMVFDPSMFKKPVTVEEWKNALLVSGATIPKVNKLYYASKYQYRPNIFEKQEKKKWWDKDLKHSDATLKQYKAYEINLDEKLERAGEALRQSKSTGTVQ
jgi:hypothetical protein